MTKFNKNTNYTFGILSNTSSPNDYNPSFKQNTPKITLNGKKLNDLSIKSFDEFLESPECPFKQTETVCCFEDLYGENGFSGLKLLDRGNPIKTSQESLENYGLNDNPSIIGSQIKFSPQDSMNKDMLSMYKNNNDELQKRINELQSELSRTTNKNIKDIETYIKKVGDLEIDIRKKEIEIETLQGLLEKYTEKSSGLNDLTSAFAPMLPSILSAGMEFFQSWKNNRNNQNQNQMNQPNPNGQVFPQSENYPQANGVING